MSRAPLPGLAASALIHIALIASVVAIIPRAERPMLFVDLTQQAAPTVRGASDPGAASRLEPTRSGAAARAGQPLASRSAPTPPPSLPLAPPPPASAEPTEARRPAEPSPAAEPGVELGLAMPAPSPAPTPATSSAGGIPRGDVAVDTGDGPGVGLGARPGQGLALARPGSAAGAGSGEAGFEYGRYLSQVRRRIQDALRYPSAARRRSLTGTVHVELTILPSGAVGAVTVVGSSSHGVLDDAAVEAIRNLRLAPFPPELPARQLRVRLPVTFELE